ncbi:MAG: sugar phosphate isomerase/epimerase [Caldilineaceae bacterium]|nr:sugar phosphate isomerase/epimerase [Caldilineaceae bacterium]
MKLSCLPVSLYADFVSGRRSLPDWFRIAADLGLDGADISVAHFNWNDRAELDRLRDNAAQAGVRIAMVVTYSDFTLPDPEARRREQAAVHAQIEAAARLEAPYVRLTAGQSWPGVARADGMVWAAEGLSQAAAYASGLGVTALYENHTRGSVWRWNDFSQPADRFLELVAATEGSDLKVLFDTANNLALWDCPETVLARVRKRVAAVHLADIEQPGAFKPVVPGMGASPHASILKILRAEGFDGWISVEEASGNGLDGLAASFRHADAVWQSIGGVPRSNTVSAEQQG